MEWQNYNQTGAVDYWPSPKRQRLSASPSQNSNTPGPVSRTPMVVTEKPLVASGLPVDYRTLLLSLAEQYISEAQRQALLIAYRQRGVDVPGYCKLISTALGYYGTVLQKHKLDLTPRQEACIQLRYAGIMFETTENVEDLETLLSKAIPACERNRLTDLKYSMQHLLARAMFKRNPRSALKYVDTLTNDATVSPHVPWIYAFRFLRSLMSANLNSPNEFNAALQNLRAISDTAQQHRDWAISAVANALEAAMYLRNRGTDFTNNAQRAIAKCRAFLAHDKNYTLEWLHFLVEYLDLACSLDPLELAAAREKVERVVRLRSQLQDLLKESDGQDPSASVRIPIHSSIANSSTIATGGLFHRDGTQMDFLNFSWLSQRERLSLYFSLVPLYVQSHRVQALQHLEDGLQWCQRTPRMTPGAHSTTLLSECKHAQWNSLIKYQVLVLLTVVRCEDSQFAKAKSSLQQLRECLQDPCLAEYSHLQALFRYIEGIVNHATGDLEAALSSYNSVTPLQQPMPDLNLHGISHVLRDVSLLARLNALLIIRPANHPCNHLLPSILESLQPYFSDSATNHTTISLNKSLVAAYEFLKTIFSTDAIIDTKVHLQRCLKMAKDAANLQLIAMGTSYLFSFMFKGIVGDKSLQYANHSLSTAKSAKSKTMQCVASGLVAGALELEGRYDEALKARQQGEELVPWLAQPLQQL